MQKPSIGRIVHYVLTELDAYQINRRRTDGDSIKDRMARDAWPEGAQAHIGTDTEAGDHVAAIVTWTNGEAASLQCFLDGNDVFYVKAKLEGAEQGTWHWPERD